MDFMSKLTVEYMEKQMNSIRQDRKNGRFRVYDTEYLIDFNNTLTLNGIEYEVKPGEVIKFIIDDIKKDTSKNYDDPVDSYYMTGLLVTIDCTNDLTGKADISKIFSLAMNEPKKESKNRLIDYISKYIDPEIKSETINAPIDEYPKPRVYLTDELYSVKIGCNYYSRNTDFDTFIDLNSGGLDIFTYISDKNNFKEFTEKLLNSYDISYEIITNNAKYALSPILKHPLENLMHTLYNGGKLTISPLRLIISICPKENELNPSSNRMLRMVTKFINLNFEYNITVPDNNRVEYKLEAVDF